MSQLIHELVYLLFSWEKNTNLYFLCKSWYIDKTSHIFLHEKRRFYEWYCPHVYKIVEFEERYD